MPSDGRRGRSSFVCALLRCGTPPATSAAHGPDPSREGQAADLHRGPARRAPLACPRRRGVRRTCGGRRRGGVVAGSQVMVPGELLVDGPDITINTGRRTITVVVENRGDRPIQVGSHYHFAETNAALAFDRAAARGCRLNIPAGTAVRFEPGQARTIELVAYGGARIVYGFSGSVMGSLDAKMQTSKRRPSKSTTKPGAKR